LNLRDGAPVAHRLRPEKRRSIAAYGLTVSTTMLNFLHWLLRGLTRNGTRMSQTAKSLRNFEKSISHTTLEDCDLMAQGI